MQQQRRRRSRHILGLLSLGLLAGAALTAHPAQAVDAVGPYYAVPSWDQKIAPANRFVVLTNWGSKAVLDKETGLVWERAVASESRVWGAGPDNARIACATRAVGGRKGWRLPSVAELTSLIDPTVTSGPALPPGHPFTGAFQTAFVWSSTTNAGDPTTAWYMGLIGGDLLTGSKAGHNQVWCVHGGMNANQY